MSDGYKKYITYFQRVTTVGILTCGKGHEDALKEAQAIMDDKELPPRCFYEETPFECSDTVEWDPSIDIVSIDPSNEGDGLDFTILFNDKTTANIAASLGKEVSEVTPEDCQTFVKKALSDKVTSNEYFKSVASGEEVPE